jgi:hypothetical protein
MDDLTPVQIDLIARAHLVSLGGEAPRGKKNISAEEYEKSLENKPTVADLAKQMREAEDLQIKDAIEKAKHDIAMAEEEMGFEPH